MVTTKQKPVLNTPKIIRKKPKHTIKEHHQDTKEKSTRRKGSHAFLIISNVLCLCFRDAANMSSVLTRLFRLAQLSSPYVWVN